MTASGRIVRLRPRKELAVLAERRKLDKVIEKNFERIGFWEKGE